MASPKKNSPIQTTIAPWLSIANGVKAVNFYKSAFGAIEKYKLETPEGIIVKLSVDGAEFWISGGYSDDVNEKPQPLGDNAIRMILTVADPNALFARALKAGAAEVFPIRDEYGWRLGRVVDPFGLHWEIGHPLH